MARRLKFKLADVQDGEESAVTIRCYQCATADGTYVQADEAAIADLSVDDDGYYVWGVDADSDYYLKIATFSEGGTYSRECNTIIGPEIGDIDTTTIEFNLIDLGLAPKSGIKVDAVVEGGNYVASGAIVDRGSLSKETNEAGVASFTVPMGATVVLSSSVLVASLEIDTTDQAFVRASSVL